MPKESECTLAEQYHSLLDFHAAHEEIDYLEFSKCAQKLMGILLWHRIDFVVVRNSREGLYRESSAICVEFRDLPEALDVLCRDKFFYFEDLPRSWKQLLTVYRS